MRPSYLGVYHERGSVSEHDERAVNDLSNRGLVAPYAVKDALTGYASGVPVLPHSVCAGRVIPLHSLRP